MNNPKAITAPPSSGVFVSTIATLKNGSFVNELDDALRLVTEAVNECQKKGSITLQLTVMPNGVGLGGYPLFQVVPNITPKAPRKAEKAQSFFADEEYNLTRRNPSQEDFKLSAVKDDEIPAEAGVKKAQ